MDIFLFLIVAFMLYRIVILELEIILYDKFESKISQIIFKILDICFVVLSTLYTIYLIVKIF